MKFHIKTVKPYDQIRYCLKSNPFTFKITDGWFRMDYRTVAGQLHSMKCTFWEISSMYDEMIDNYIEQGVGENVINAAKMDKVKAQWHVLKSFALKVPMEIESVRGFEIFLDFLRFLHTERKTIVKMSTREFGKFMAEIYQLYPWAMHSSSVMNVPSDVRVEDLYEEDNVQEEKFSQEENDDEDWMEEYSQMEDNQEVSYQQEYSDCASYTYQE